MTAGSAKTASTVIHPRVTDLGTLLTWFDSRRMAPTWQDVVTRFECSRPTAFRWLALYRHRIAETGSKLNAVQPPARNLSDSQGVDPQNRTESTLSISNE